MSENMFTNDLTAADELTAIDSARRLGIDLNRLYVLLRLGRLDGRKVNGEWRVRGDAVEERLRKRQYHSQAAAV
jgi:hypothetical protein